MIAYEKGDLQITQVLDLLIDIQNSWHAYLDSHLEIVRFHLGYDAKGTAQKGFLDQAATETSGIPTNVNISGHSFLSRSKATQYFYRDLVFAKMYHSMFAKKMENN